MTDEPDSKKGRFLVGTVVVLLLLAAVVWFGRPAYGRWQARRNIA